jgi:hypothetical protein
VRRCNHGHHSLSCCDCASERLQPAVSGAEQWGQVDRDLRGAVEGRSRGHVGVLCGDQCECATHAEADHTDLRGNRKLHHPTGPCCRCSTHVCVHACADLQRQHLSAAFICYDRTFFPFLPR